MTTFTEVMQDIDKQNNRITELTASWGDSMPSKAQLDEVKSINQKIGELEAQAADFEEGDAIRKAAAERKERLNAPRNYIGHPMPGDNPNNGSSGERKDSPLKPGETWGEFFTNAPEIKEWQARVMPHGKPSEKMHVQSPVLQMPVSIKALLTGASATSAGAMVANDVMPLVALPYRPLTIRDIITNGRTGSDTVEYPRVTSQTNNAAPVAEATASSGSSGVKPESDMALEVVSTSVKTIAHWIPATRRALADAAQLQTLINSFLMYGLEEELEDQIVNGSGSGENFTGIKNTTGLQTQAFSTDMFTTTRKALTKVRVTGRARPNAWLMHPNDLETLDLAKDAENRFYYGGPQMIGNARLWGLPIVETEAVTAGYAYVGDFRQVVLWDRMEATIQTTDSHSDFFIRNLIAILAELRAALGVLRPAAICEADIVA